MQREILDSPDKFFGHGKVKDIGVVAEHTDMRRDSAETACPGLCRAIGQLGQSEALGQ